MIQQGDSLLAGFGIGQIPAQQIQHPIGQQVIQLLLKAGLLIRQLAHSLLQFDAVPQQLCSRLVTPLLLLIPGRVAAGEGCQQREVRFTATAKGWRLRRLQTLTGELESFRGRSCLPQQDQSSHFAAGSEIEADGFIGMG